LQVSCKAQGAKNWNKTPSRFASPFLKLVFLFFLKVLLWTI
jgi:hypothetical protein